MDAQGHVSGQHEHVTASDQVATAEPVAVVGIGCRFPGGAAGPDELWELLDQGREHLREVPPDRWDVDRFWSPDPATPGRGRVRRGGFLDEDVTAFDPGFFGISPREADAMDPQQRLLLMVAWEAIEDAGRPWTALAGRPVGVYVGGFTLDYKLLQFGGASREALHGHTATGVVATMLSNRLSHALDLLGPSLTVDTACSSSLVAVHLAVRALRGGECEVALAGGVNLMLSPDFTVAESKGGFLSPRGRSRAFDAAADGYVRGEGAGVVVLRPLRAALAAGDRVYAVLRGTAVSQDGRTDGITVPNPASQQLAARAALADAGIDPSTVAYVEAHGTGTPVGDPLEARAVAEVYGRVEDPVLVGSVKTNIGHLEAAAGVAGLIKAALVLHHRRVPAHLGLTEVNPLIDLDGWGLRVPARTEALAPHDPAGVVPGRAAVNSFGFGGTNAHAVLEEAPRAVATPEPTPEPTPGPGREPVRAGWPSLVPLSARDDGALRALAGAYADRWEGGGDDLAVLPGALAHQQTHHPHARLAVTSHDRDVVPAALAAHAAGAAHPALHAGGGAGAPRLALVLSGMGPQTWSMGRVLLRSNPVFAAAVQECDELLGRHLPYSVLDLLRADGPDDGRLASTLHAQPANFALQVGLVQVWRRLGLGPDAVVGHSAGEAAAAWAAGALSLPDAALVAATRSTLQQRTAGQGRLLAVALAPDQAALLDAVVAGAASVAAVNGPSSVALVGAEDDLTALADELAARQVWARLVPGDVPYHGPRMDPLEDDLRAALAGLAPQAPAVPLWSTVTGEQVVGAVHDAGYWWRNVREPVAFERAVRSLRAAGTTAFVEVGPHPVLGAAVRETAAAGSGSVVVVGTLRRDADDLDALGSAAAQMWAAGVDLDWDLLCDRPSRRVRLERYPWQLSRHWAEEPEARADRLGRHDHPLLGRRGPTPEPAWSRDLDASRPGSLADHRVMGANLFPGAGYVEQALAVADAHYGTPFARVEDLAFVAPLVLEPGSADTVRVTLDPASGRVTTWSRPGGSGSGSGPGSGAGSGTHAWRRHATAMLRPARPAPPAPGAEELAALCPTAVDVPRLYADLAAGGFGYGPSYRLLEDVRHGEGVATARVEVPVDGADAGGHLPPAVLDAAFQLLLALVVQHPEQSLQGLLPAGAEAITLHGPVGGLLTCVATADVDPGGGSGDLVGDLLLLDASGTVVAEVERFRATRLDGTGSSDPLGPVATAPEPWMHHIAWEPVDLDLSAPAGAPGEVLLLADRAGTAEALAAALRTAGQPCVLAHPGEPAPVGHDDEDRWYVIGSGDRSDDAAEVVRRAADTGRRWRAVVDLTALDTALDAVPDAPDTAATAEHRGRDVPAAVHALLEAQLRLVQALADGPSCPLWVVTRGAQATGPGSGSGPRSAASSAEASGDVVGVGGLVQAPLWGLGRVLHQESLPLAARLVDLDAAADVEASAAALAPLLTAAEVDQDQLAHRDGRWLSPRLQPTERLGSLPFVPRADGAYLVTGGLGSLGLLTARWLADGGAGEVVLASRRRRDDLDPQADAGLLAELAAIEATGTVLECLPVDVADTAQLRGWLTRRRERGARPVRGVLHSAGVLRDQVLERLTVQDLRAVLAPKVDGAWALHLALADEPVEVFALYSSVASVLATPGQAGYAAANAFLDALAVARRASGLPAVTIGWGPWDAGMITEQGLREHYRRRGIDLVTASTGTAVLGHVLGSRAVHPVVVRADWPTLVAAHPIVPRLIDHLARLGTEGATGATADLRARLAGAEPGDRAAIVLEGVVDVVCGALRLDPTTVDASRPLTSLGLDSMVAVEVRVRLEQAFGVAPPVVLLLQGTGLDGVAAAVGDLLDRAGAEVTLDAELEQLLQGLDDASLDDLLATLEADGDREGTA